jgi:carboxylate-amine ligase
LLTAIAQDAEAQGCTSEIGRVVEILTCGTSADRQIAAYEDMRESGCTDAEALKGVVDLLVSETRKVEKPAG